MSTTLQSESPATASRSNCWHLPEHRAARHRRSSQQPMWTMSTTPRTWLDRLFCRQTAADGRLASAMQSCSCRAVLAYPVTTAGRDRLRSFSGRSDSAADAAWTHWRYRAEAEAQRRAAAVLDIEDAARIPGLESALTRDLADGAGTEGIDRAIFIGDSTARPAYDGRHHRAHHGRRCWSRKRQSSQDQQTSMDLTTVSAFMAHADRRARHAIDPDRT